MHEMAMALEIVNSVKEILDQHPGTILKKVHINIGEFAAVVPASLKFSYEAIISDSPLKDSKLEINIIPVTAICNQCKKSFSINELEFCCPNCKSQDVYINTGDELLITNLEVE